MKAEWPEHTVGELFTVVGGGTPSTRVEEYWNGEIPWVTSADLQPGGMLRPRRQVTARAIEESAANVVPAGSVIVATRVGLGKVGITTEPTAFSQDCNGLVVDHDRIDSKFAVYQLQHWVQSFRFTSRGTTIAGVTKRQLLDLPFRVPPLDVQRAVAARIEEQLSRLDAATEALKRAARNLATFEASSQGAALSGAVEAAEAGDVDSGAAVLQKILAERRRRWVEEKGSANGYREPSGPDASQVGQLPTNWSAATLEQLTDPIRTIGYGILMPKAHTPGGIPYVRVKDIVGDRIDLPGLRRTTPEIASAYRRSTLRAGDLLIAIRGSYGRVAIVPPELDGGNITQDSARLDLNPIMLREYVAAYLRGPAAQAFLRRVARGVAVKGVNIGDLRHLPVPVPPPLVQRLIVNGVERNESLANWLRDDIQNALDHALSLRRAVLGQALTPDRATKWAA